MMKKTLLFFCGLCFAFSANAAVVLSDTSVSGGGDDYVFYASQSQDDTYKNNYYISEQIAPASATLLSNDTSDPLFLIPKDRFLTDTHVSYVSEKFRIGQYFGYGINNSFEIHANTHYQIDFTHEHQHGFSATELGAVYRMNHGSSELYIISDALFGIKVGGSSYARMPEYADSSYYAGLRFGRQYTGLSLSGTIKSTWVFDDARGLSYIDFIPEAYFRFEYDCHAGIGFDLRKSTDTYLLDDQEWLNFKFIKQFGNTQYVWRLDYEFEGDDVQVGLNVKMLF